MVTRLFLALGVLVAGVARAHPRGVHERIVMTVGPTQVEALVTLDADSGAPGQFLRMGADLNGNGKLDRNEREALKAVTARRMREALEAHVSGYPLKFVELSSKLDLRGNARRSDEGLSVAVLLRARFPEPPTDGMELVVGHKGSEATHVVATVFVGAVTADRGASVSEQELEAGVPLRVRLQGLR